MDNNLDTNNNQEKEIDLIEVIRKLWRNRKLILKMTLVFMLLGVIVALFSAKEYTASCTMVPQTGDTRMGGGLSGLAAIAGINLGDMGSAEILSPQVYPIILRSVPFQKELINTPFNFEKIDHPVTLMEYYTNKEYQSFNLISFVKKYTIGLPGVLINAIRGEKEEGDVINDSEAILSLTKEEKRCIGIAESRVNLTINTKDGYIELTVNMPEPLLAAQVTEKIQALLQEYITEFKIEQVKSNLDFVQERFNETKQEFEHIQIERAAFRDANKNMTSAKAQTEQERLDTRYNLSYAIYSELAKQLEQAKISVKETTPILTVIDPVTIPLERSKPKRAMICILFTFLGGLIGCFSILILPFIADVTGSKKIGKLIVG